MIGADQIEEYKCYILIDRLRDMFVATPKWKSISRIANPLLSDTERFG